jgi:hypothetical protein
VKANASRPRRGQPPSPQSVGRTTEGDRLALTRDDDLRGIVIDLDEAHDSLLARALNGDNEAFALAQIVKTAADLVAELRLGGQH